MAHEVATLRAGGKQESILGSQRGGEQVDHGHRVQGSWFVMGEWRLMGFAAGAGEGRRGCYCKRARHVACCMLLPSPTSALQLTVLVETDSLC